MQIYSVWLIPRSVDYQRIVAQMRQIADRLNTPIFRPHLTIGSVTTKIELESFVGGISIPPQIPLEIDGEAVFTRSLYLRMKMSDALSKLRQKLETHPGSHIGRLFDPHISLCYGPPPENAISPDQEASLISSPIVFDRIELTQIKVPVETYEDVLSWKTISSVPINREAC